MTASRPVSITAVSWRPCFMTPVTRQRQCTLPRGHDPLDWFYGLEVVQRSTLFVTSSLTVTYPLQVFIVIVDLMVISGFHPEK